MSDVLNSNAFTPSINKVIKHLRREENGLYNCIRSIVIDTAFVREICALYPGIPVAANLRCGLWYTPNPDLTCYFKSTDGHFSNWSFSLTRLNTHVALRAAESGGCLIVDATRRGKVFPDAFAKTIPIWAAVLNCAVAAVRLRAVKKEYCTRLHAKDEDESSTQQIDWDVELHLPPWISATEKAQIEQRLDAWAFDLMQSGADLEGLSRALKKPLRALWISQQSRIWLNEVPSCSELAFTPLILVSASTPNARQRHVDDGAHEEGGYGGSFEYVPGAGDDEESWARGLTPALLWNNRQTLLGAGPQGIADAVESLLGSSRTSNTAASDHGQADAAQSPRDAHHPAPLGCRPASAAQARSDTSRPCFLAGTRIALGGFAAGHADHVWEAVDAVLNVGLQEHAGMNRLHDSNGARYLWLPIKSAKSERHALESALPAALYFLSGHLQQGRRVLVHCMEGTDQSVCVVVALLLCCFSAPGASGQGSPIPFVWSQAASGGNVARELETSLSSPPRGDDRASQGAKSVQTGANSPAMPESSRAIEAENCAAVHRDVVATVEERRQDGAVVPEISKAAVRQQLAFLSACYPSACPSRGMLRQTFNFVKAYWEADLADRNLYDTR